MRKIKYIRYIKGFDRFGQEVEKMIVPNFFSMISDADEYRIYEKFNTPLDILQDVLVFDSAKYQRGVKNKELGELLVQSKELEGKCSYDSVKAISAIILECGKRINGLKLKTCTLNDKAKRTVEKKAKHEAIEKLKKLKPNDNTILYILGQCFDSKDNNDFKKYSMLTLNLLFSSKKIQVLKCFRKNNMDLDEVLIKIKEEYDFNLFGNKYQKVKRIDLV